MASIEHSLEIHAQAVERLLAAVRGVPASQWSQPYAEGKWTPGEITAHLVTVWDVLLRELRGGPGMAIRTSWWLRLILRWKYAPGILAGKGFPPGIRAPRETRPASAFADPAAAEAAILERAKAFAHEARAGVEQGRKLTHAFFGKAALPASVLLAARHVEHHTAQIEIAVGAF
ncbi:MAG: DinB family protein [Thermoanaerobaculia bacterium]